MFTKSTASTVAIAIVALNAASTACGKPIPDDSDTRRTLNARAGPSGTPAPTPVNDYDIDYDVNYYNNYFGGGPSWSFNGGQENGGGGNLPWFPWGSNQNQNQNGQRPKQPGQPNRPKQPVPKDRKQQQQPNQRKPSNNRNHRPKPQQHKSGVRDVAPAPVNDYDIDYDANYYNNYFGGWGPSWNFNGGQENGGGGNLPWLPWGGNQNQNGQRPKQPGQGQPNRPKQPAPKDRKPQQPSRNQHKKPDNRPKPHQQPSQPKPQGSGRKREVAGNHFDAREPDLEERLRARRDAEDRQMWQRNLADTVELFGRGAFDERDVGNERLEARGYEYGSLDALD